MKPYRLRMFAETCCEFALWPDPGRVPPIEGVDDEVEVGDLEQVLPLSDDLRTRILEWATLYERYDGGQRNLDMSDFDERGMLMSRELQRELGPDYGVDYRCTFEGSRERLLPRVDSKPCPGWRLR